MASGQGWPEVAELGEFSSLPVVAAPPMWPPEEAGWRGFAVPELLKTKSLLPTALVVGVLWALWHVPSMFVIETYRELGFAFLPGFFLGIVSGSIFGQASAESAPPLVHGPRLECCVSPIERLRVHWGHHEWTTARRRFSATEIDSISP